MRSLSRPLIRVQSRSNGRENTHLACQMRAACSCGNHGKLTSGGRHGAAENGLGLPRCSRLDSGPRDEYRARQPPVDSYGTPGGIASGILWSASGAQAQPGRVPRTYPLSGTVRRHSRFLPAERMRALTPERRTWQSRPAAIGQRRSAGGLPVWRCRQLARRSCDGPARPDIQHRLQRPEL